MKRLFLAAAGLLAISCLAEAADMPLKAPPPIAPVYTWTGLYLGLNAGGGTANSAWCTNATQGIAGCADGDLVSQTASSFTVGGQVGYRYQWGNLVFGAEGMIGLFAASVTSPAAVPVPNRVRTTRFDALYSATGQLGYAMGSLLFYGKGGWAGTGIQFDANNLNSGPGIPADLFASQNVSGYTAGAGLEWLILPNFSVGVEYDYYSFNVGSINGLANSGGIIIPCAFCNVSETVQTALARVNLKFPTQ